MSVELIEIIVLLSVPNLLLLILFAVIPRKVRLLDQIKVTCATDLSPEAHKLCRGLISAGKRLEDENASNQEIMGEAFRAAVIDTLLRNSKINQTTLHFIQSQIREQEKLPKGRRFSMKDKIFALYLLKQRNKSHRFLQKIFALPSQTTLVTILNKL